MKKIFCFLTIACCFSLTTAAKAQEFNPQSQDLSMSVGKATFFKLTDSKRTKPNFIDIGLDKLLQKFLAATAQEGVTVDYSFLEFLPSEKSVILTNLKITGSKEAFQGEVFFGSFKVGMKDLLNSLQKHSISFSQINAGNVKANIAVSRNKKPVEKIIANAQTVQLSDATLGPCSWQKDFLAMMKGEEVAQAESEQPAPREPNQPRQREKSCLTAMRVFAANGSLNRSLHKQKYAVKEGVLNGVFLKLNSPNNPLIFSIGQVNGKTVRTPEELFNALKQ